MRLISIISDFFNFMEHQSVYWSLKLVLGKQRSAKMVGLLQPMRHWKLLCHPSTRLADIWRQANTLSCWFQQRKLILIVIPNDRELLDHKQKIEEKIFAELRCATCTVVRHTRKFDRDNFWRSSVVELLWLSNYCTWTLVLSFVKINPDAGNTRSASTEVGKNSFFHCSDGGSLFSDLNGEQLYLFREGINALAESSWTATFMKYLLRAFAREETTADSQTMIKCLNNWILELRTYARTGPYGNRRVRKTTEIMLKQRDKEFDILHSPQP